MKTTKPISTISYNSEAFLKARLEELVKAKVLEFWTYVIHKGEDDEDGLKEHIHLYAVPARSVQTVDLADLFVEPDPAHPTKPFRCMAFRSSKFNDWYLYATHDKAYLASKGLEKKYSYSDEMFTSSDDDQFKHDTRLVDRKGFTLIGTMVDAINNGITWDKFLLQARFPVQQIASVKTAWYDLQKTLQHQAEGELYERRLAEQMERAVPDSRGVLIDPKTGEVVDAGEVTETEELPY